MSLRWRLLLIIGVSLTLLWAGVAAWVFVDARQSLRDTLDKRLAASARMVAGLVAQFPEPKDISLEGGRPLGVMARDGVACEVSLVRGEVVIQSLARTAGSPDLTGAEQGFSNQEYGGKRWRTYVFRQGDIQIATADSIEVRDALVQELMISAGLPFVVALLGSMVVLWLGVTHGLRPLEHIRNLLARRRPGDDSPLPKVRAPEELRPLLHTIEELLERLQAAILHERRFTDSAAHELRTPLTAIKTHIQIAKLASERPAEKATLDASLARADTGVQQLQNILQRLLELARLEEESIDDAESDPAVAVADAIEAISLLHGDAVHRVQVKIGNGIRPVGVAQSLLVVAIQNLIDNALRYGSPDFPVKVCVAPAGNDFMRISVFDRGPGLDQQDREQAVNRFWRGSSKTPGYGLGLSIVNAITRRYGGTLELLEYDGGGLEARLLFPVMCEQVST